MSNGIRTTRASQQKGTALLISIFALLLISAVAISLVVMGGMESSINANYKSATTIYYNTRAGLEEARGRLWSKNPNPLTASGFPASTAPLPLGQVWYITNPAAEEVVDPKTPGTTYYDNEYASEWGVPVTGATVQPYVASVASLAGTPNAPYKWVRITATTEASANLDVNGDGVKDPATPLVYDGTQFLLSTQLTANATYPVYTVTALAVTPSGGQRTEEYLTAMTSLNLNFPSPLTLVGQNIAFKPANSAGYSVNGQDGSGNPPAVAGCAPNPSNSKPAISATDATGSNTNKQTIVNDINSTGRQGNYTGGGLSVPSVSDTFSLTNSLQSPASLNQLVQTLSQTAVVVPGPATQANLPPMSASNPQIVVVNGDLTLSGNYTGYGLLVVTGNFTYNGNDGWRGIVLVVGDGTTTYIGNGGGNNEFDGAMFVATIKDANGNVLSNFGNVSYDISGGGGNGVYYNSCWVNSVQQSAGLKILSFREISN